MDRRQNLGLTQWAKWGNVAERQSLEKFKEGSGQMQSSRRETPNDSSTAGPHLSQKVSRRVPGLRKCSAAREPSCPLERQSRPRAEGSAASAPPRLRRRAGVLDRGCCQGLLWGWRSPGAAGHPAPRRPGSPARLGGAPGSGSAPAGNLVNAARARGPPALRTQGRGSAPGAGEGQDRLPTPASQPAGNGKARAEYVRRL